MIEWLNVSFCSAKHMAFKHKLEVQNGRNSTRAEQLRRKTSDDGEEGPPRPARVLTMGHGAHHGQLVVVPGSALLHFLFDVSSEIFLNHGICHGMLVLGHFLPLMLSTLIHKASRSSFTLMI